MSAYSRDVSRLVRLSLACPLIPLVLGLSACTTSADTDELSPSAVVPTGGSTFPTPPVTQDPHPSFPAGIPTADPVPPSDDAPAPHVDLSPRLTIATYDTSAGGWLVGGFVSGVVEDGGECMFTVTGADGSEFVAQTVGVENVGTTSCGSTAIPAADVPSGEYSIVLRYVSDRGEARSDAVSVRVP